MSKNTIFDNYDEFNNMNGCGCGCGGSNSCKAKKLGFDGEDGFHNMLPTRRSSARNSGGLGSLSLMNKHLDRLGVKPRPNSTIDRLRGNVAKKPTQIEVLAQQRLDDIASGKIKPKTEDVEVDDVLSQNTGITGGLLNQSQVGIKPINTTPTQAGLGGNKKIMIIGGSILAIGLIILAVKRIRN